MSKHLEKDSLGQLAPEAWAQFGKVCRDTEAMITAAFGAEKFNYLALMMVDPEVHFHVIPRYSKPVYFMDREFIDNDWPEATRRIPIDMSTSTKRAIEQHLLKIISN